MHEFEPKTKQIANSLGGADNMRDYKTTEKPYYDKKDHYERSSYHQPNHEKSDVGRQIRRGQ